MLRFTRSKDGRPRATVRVAFRVGDEELCRAVAELLYDAVPLELDAMTEGDEVRTWAEKYAATMSRSAVERELREVLRHRGDEGVMVEDEQAAICIDVAPVVVERLWPELFAQRARRAA